MVQLLFLLVLQVAVMGLGHAADCIAEECLVELTEENFDEVVSKESFMVVEFFAPWCGHCQTLKPIIEETAALLAPHGVTMATVDIEDPRAQKLHKKYQVTNIPAIKLFRKGQVFEYEGPVEMPLKAQDLVDYILEEKDKGEKQNLGEDPVISLTKATFDPTVESAELMLVEFYADWCPQCQKLEPVLAAAARRLRKQAPPIPMGKVKVPDELDVAQRFGLSDYPLMKVFRKGKVYNYTGPSNEEGIVEYMKKQSGPGSKFLESAKQVREFLKGSWETRALGFFSNDTDSKLVDEFIESGNFLREFVSLGHTNVAAVAKEMGMPLQSVVIFHPRHLVSEYEQGRYVIRHPPSNATALSELYLEHVSPLVGEMTKENGVRLFWTRPLLVAYMEIDWSRDGIKATQHWHSLIASVAKDHQQDDSSSGIKFAIANERDFPNDLRVLGLSEWGEDIAVGIFQPHSVKYAMNEELSKETLTEFVEDFLSGSLKPHLTSEPAPRQDRNALVRTVVGSTFQKVVLNPDKNVVVKLCVPAHEAPKCEEAEDWYRKVAKKYRGVKNLVFAEMNVAANDPPVGTRVDSLPALFFSPLKSKEMSPVNPSPDDAETLQFFFKHVAHIYPPKDEL